MRPPAPKALPTNVTNKTKDIKTINFLHVLENTRTTEMKIDLFLLIIPFAQKSKIHIWATLFYNNYNKSATLTQGISLNGDFPFTINFTSFLYIHCPIIIPNFPLKCKLSGHFCQIISPKPEISGKILVSEPFYCVFWL
ncbi:hypothetical protein ES703_07474 [subsurface metagenome]